MRNVWGTLNECVSASATHLFAHLARWSQGVSSTLTFRYCDGEVGVWDYFLMLCVVDEAVNAHAMIGSGVWVGVRPDVVIGAVNQEQTKNHQILQRSNRPPTDPAKGKRAGGDQLRSDLAAVTLSLALFLHVPLLYSGSLLWSEKVENISSSGNLFFC